MKITQSPADSGRSNVQSVGRVVFATDIRWFVNAKCVRIGYAPGVFGTRRHGMEYWLRGVPFCSAFVVTLLLVIVSALSGRS